MIIFMAGGISGNLKPLFMNIIKDPKMEIFLAGQNYKNEFCKKEIEKQMKIFLAGTMYGNQASAIEALKIQKPLPAILESFYYADETVEKLIPFYKDFLLDSGAFTYMTGNGSAVDWEEYIDHYADFINRNKVKKFIELDIDAIVGYEEVKRLRKILIQKTNHQPIPVWHKNRGREEYLHMCDEFPYVALGGFAIKSWVKKDFKFIPWFIHEAHQRDARIHGLGFTYFNYLEKLRFDSVDSSSWTSGNRFGHICKFNGNRIINISKPEGMKLKNPRAIALNNFNEWVKFANYAEEEL